MRIKQIEWDDGYSFAGVQHIFVKLPLEGFSAKLTSYPHACLWNIRTRLTLMASGEELSLSLAKVACQKAWEKILMGAFENEGCDYCLKNQSLGGLSTTCAVVYGQTAELMVEFPDPNDPSGVYLQETTDIEYCPKCGRKLGCSD